MDVEFMSSINELHSVPCFCGEFGKVLTIESLGSWGRA